MSIEIGFDPIIFNIGSFEVAWHGVMVVLAVITGVAASMWFAKGTGIKKETIIGFAPWAVLGGIIGARLFHVFDHFASTYVNDPVLIITKFYAGLSILGAILGGTLAGYIYAKITRVQLGHLADVIAPGLLLAQAVGRIGCTINGDVYGKPTTLPWALIYTHPNAGSTTILNEARHPSPVYEMIWVLIVFAIIWKLRGKLKPDGSLFLLQLCLYSIGRFGIEFTRGVSPSGVDIGGWHSPHFITLATLAVCVPLLIYRMKKERALSQHGDIQDI